jgi:hypothetical protein
MDRREFIAAAGTAAALASTSQAFAQGGEEPKYKALEKTSIECVATGNDCLRHCLRMYKMKDTSMAECADSVFQPPCVERDPAAAILTLHRRRQTASV